MGRVKPLMAVANGQHDQTRSYEQLHPKPYLTRIHFG